MSAEWLVPVAPERGPDRLVWLNSLSESVALDAVATARRLSEECEATPADVAGILACYARYICTRICDAIELGGDLWEATR